MVAYNHCKIPKVHIVAISCCTTEPHQAFVINKMLDGWLIRAPSWRADENHSPDGLGLNNPPSAKPESWQLLIMPDWCMYIFKSEDNRRKLSSEKTCPSTTSAISNNFTFVDSHIYQSTEMSKILILRRDRDTGWFCHSHNLAGCKALPGIQRVSSVARRSQELKRCPRRALNSDTSVLASHPTTYVNRSASQS